MGSRLKNTSQTPDQVEGSLLLTVQNENSSNDQGLLPGAAI